MKRSTSPGGEPAGSKADDNKSDRKSPFQVLADGTQDLAALVGIFATNSVERYAVDYSKGHFSVASSLLSFLGLLGYVRALVKLALGSEGCQNAGFDTRSLRPLFGVPDEDRLPSDAVRQIYYVERSRSAQYVSWKLAATRKHTVDSMPIIGLVPPEPPNAVDRNDKVIGISSSCLTAKSEKWYRKHARYQEQLPTGDTDWIRRWSDAGIAKRLQSMQRKDYFAFTAYICQYLEVRQTTTRQATVWLAAQGALAIARVAVWIWNPTFDDVTMQKDFVQSHVQLSEAQLVMLWYSQIDPIRIGAHVASRSSKRLHRHLVSPSTAASSPQWPLSNIPDELKIPIWVLHGLNQAETNLPHMFSLALALYSKDEEWQWWFHVLRDAELSWDMPKWLFMLWVDAHTDQRLQEIGVVIKRYSCRVIQDCQGQIHFIPFWTRRSDLLPIDEATASEEVKNYGPLGDGNRLCVFGNPELDDRCIVSICDGRWNQTTAPRPHRYDIGWDASLLGTDLRPEAVEETRKLWINLERILALAERYNALRESSEKRNAERFKKNGHT
ncbi:MAG: hypothetical protein Q9209_007658 [Squamulea sp. 1 TL-2023]